MTYNENKELFIEAYNSNIWKINDYNYKFYSGIGSHKTDITNKYITYINKFISDYNIHTLLDFGCGDFNIGKQYKVNMYYGIDIIDNLLLIHDIADRFADFRGEL